MCIAVACRREPVEPIMSQALMTMRKAIDVYYAKQHHYPHALPDLVRDGELRTIPIDPVTHSPATWRPTFSEKVRVDAVDPSLVLDVEPVGPANPATVT